LKLQPDDSVRAHVFGFADKRRQRLGARAFGFGKILDRRQADERTDAAKRRAQHIAGPAGVPVGKSERADDAITVDALERDDGLRRNCHQRRNSRRLAVNAATSTPRYSKYRPISAALSAKNHAYP
jgi:hypothetical protein